MKRWLALGLILMTWALAARAQQASVREEFVGGRAGTGWEIYCSPGNRIVYGDGWAEIQADEHTYAHLSRSLGEDCVTVSARIRPSNPAGMTWCTSVFLVWDGGNWCQMGIASAGDGGRYYAVETVGGYTIETYMEPAGLGEWHYVRIQLGKDCIRYFASEDGKRWACLRVIERPQQFEGAPNRLVVGKGYGRGVSPYAGPYLQNDYPQRGQRVASRVAEIRVEPTPARQLSLTPGERRKIREDDVDPVGQIELRGKADPTFESVSKYYPAMKYPKEAVGVPEHPVDIAIDHLGRLQLNYNQPPVAWLEIGDPPVAFGDEKSRIERRWLDGYIPVLTLSTVREGVRYGQTVFGWSDGMSPDKQLYAYVRIEAISDSRERLPNRATLVAGTKRIDFEMKHNGSRERRTAWIKVSFPDTREVSAISESDWDRALGEVESTWRAYLSRAARFEIPEQRVNDAYKAWLAYAQLDVDKINGVYEPHDGIGFYEENYGYSCTLHCIALDMYGLHDKAERYLDSILHFQQPDGLYTQNFGLPDMGALLMALSDHYEYTGNKAWLKRVAGNMIRAGDWLIRMRSTAPKEGPVKGLIKYRPYCDYPEPEVNYFADAYCCVGLEKASAALSAIGMKDDAERFRKEAERYRADILASMDAAAIQLEGRTVLPLVPENHRLLKSSGYTGGDYYGLVACCLLESGFLAARDKRAYWITDFMEQKKGLISGVCKFQSRGIDHAYTYGYLMQQMDRGDARKVVLGLYGMLAYGMTRDTYSAVECTNVVTGANAWTLPHLYSATQQLRLLRNMIIRESGSAIRIGDAIPREWLEDGKVIRAMSAPTTFGEVSFSISSRVKEGRITLRLSPPQRRQPERIVITLRHPGHEPIRSVYVNGKLWRRHSGETIELKGMHTPAKIEVLYGNQGIGE